MYPFFSTFWRVEALSSSESCGLPLWTSTLPTDGQRSVVGGRPKCDCDFELSFLPCPASQSIDTDAARGASPRWTANLKRQVSQTVLWTPVGSLTASTSESCFPFKHI